MVNDHWPLIPTLMKLVWPGKAAGEKTTQLLGIGAPVVASRKTPDVVVVSGTG